MIGKYRAVSLRRALAILSLGAFSAGIVIGFAVLSP